MSKLALSESGAGDVEASQEPPGYGLGMAVMAVFVIISSMVGVGVLTTSGFTVAAVGSNQPWGATS